LTEAVQRNWKLLIAGGGTGGHVFPALAIAREWMSRGPEREAVFVGTQRGIEARLVPEAGFPLETIRSAGLKGIGGIRLARNAAKLAPAMWDSFSILRRHKFSAALGVGGYAAGPMILAAVSHGLPTVVFEPNAEPGEHRGDLANDARPILTDQLEHQRLAFASAVGIDADHRDLEPGGVDLPRRAAVGVQAEQRAHRDAHRHRL